MVEIDRVTSTDYSLTVHYNGGEGELTIHCTFGQCGGVYWCIIQTGVDGILRVLQAPMRDEPRNVPTAMQMVLHDWLQDSVDQSKQSKIAVVNRVWGEFQVWCKTAEVEFV